MLDPIIYRESAVETQPTKETETQPQIQNEVLRVEGTLVDQPHWLIPFEEIQAANQFFLQSQNEIVTIQSNIVLPEGLRAYNESWGNTYIEYLTASLAPVPEVSQEQQELIYKGFWSMFTWMSVVLLFSFFVMFLFSLLKFRWTK